MGFFEPLRLFIIFLTIDAAQSSYTYCAYLDSDTASSSHIYEDDSDQGDLPGSREIMPDNRTMRCPKKRDYCYTLWQVHPTNKSILTILKQGCWFHPSRESDCSPECESTKPNQSLNNTKFCCCVGSMCNVNISDTYDPQMDTMDVVSPAFHYVFSRNNQEKTVIIILAAICPIVLIAIFGCLAYRLWQGQQKPDLDSLHLMEASPPTPALELEHLKLMDMIGRGRYGTVWQGTLHDIEVAVKIFSPQHKQYFLNEKDIYSQPYMDHPSLLKCLGGDDRLTTEGRLEYLLVLSYQPLGSLQDFLRNNVIDWASLCKMSHSIASGLAHLHTDIKKIDKLKPVIAHRDLNSRNILIRPDNGCVICDLGFAMKLNGSKYVHNGDEQKAESVSLTDVGTLRYMAPEVLEGAVNLRDCEASLKQIDVYSLGLVLWEIATRCSELYQGLEVPEYQLPFQAETGPYPTFEQMQVLVSRNKARPLFPEIWKDSHQAIRALKETIEDCWDQDAEARLTALCVEERLLDLPSLWERHKGASPTIAGILTGSQITNVCNPTPSAHDGRETTDRNGNITLLGLLPKDLSLTNRHSRQRESSASENTVETTLSLSPSDPPPEVPIKNNVQGVPYVRLATPLQPYQGRNPCIERNMNMEPVEEVAISGNTLLEKNSYHYKEDDYMNTTDDIFDVLSDNFESSLVTHDILNHTRTSVPIPFVQNAVHNYFMQPKQENVPGNGQHKHSNNANVGRMTVNQARAQKSQFPNPFSHKFEKRKSAHVDNKPAKEGRIRSLLERKRISKSHYNIEDEGTNVKDVSCVGNSGHQRSMSDGNQNSKSNLVHNLKSPVQTEVCFMQGSQTIVRPTNGLLINLDSGNENSLNLTEVGVARFHASNSLPNGQAPVIKSRSNSSSQNSIIDIIISSNDSPENSDTKLKRPTSLSLKGHNFSQKKLQSNKKTAAAVAVPLVCIESVPVSQNCNPMRNSPEAKIKIERRVKTPYSIKKGRFSLHDDRIMSQSDQSFNNGPVWNLNCVQSKLSRSVPLDIDALCASQADELFKKYTSGAKTWAESLSSTNPSKTFKDICLLPAVDEKCVINSSSDNSSTQSELTYKVSCL